MTVEPVNPEPRAGEYGPGIIPVEYRTSTGPTVQDYRTGADIQGYSTVQDITGPRLLNNRNNNHHEPQEQRIQPQENCIADLINRMCSNNFADEFNRISSHLDRREQLIKNVTNHFITSLVVRI